MPYVPVSSEPRRLYEQREKALAVLAARTAAQKRNERAWRILMGEVDEDGYDWDELDYYDDPDEDLADVEWPSATLRRVVYTLGPGESFSAHYGADGVCRLVVSKQP
jgi:hypothetical protein